MSKRENIFELLESFGLRNATLPYVLEKKAEENQDKIFTIFKDQEISYKETNERANRIAHGLLKLNLGRKPKIAIMFPNIPEFLDCWFGIAKIGGVIVPINIHLKGDMLQYLLDDSDSENLIIDYSYLKAFEAIKERVPKIKTVIVLNAPKSVNLDYVLYDEINDPTTENPSIKVRDFQPMEIMYTSGTTGRPKGVLYRQYFTLAGLLVGSELIEGGLKELAGDLILYCPLPLFHSFAQFLAIMPTMFLGGRVVIADKFHASTFWDEVKRYKATIICYIGGILQILLKQPVRDSERAHNARIAFGGGCPRNIWEVFEERFNVKIYEGWSLSEGVGFTINKEGTDGGKIGSIGKSLEGFNLKIVDEDGKELPPAEDPHNPKPENIGEILAKSSLPIGLEYYKKTDIVKKKTEADGYVHTGDLGYKDKEGYVYFSSRKKDMIRRRGENISAKEVERVSNQHPSILQSAAFAVPSDITGDEEVKLVVVMKEGEELTPVELLNFMKERTAYFMLPRYVEFKTEEEFANYKTATERIQKYKFKDEFYHEVIKKKTWDGKKEGYKFK
ncbi:MAG: AMP-binding protein [Candidatus Helarchaeota archaeon]|nr:AMP-binding protein [Candidatus Helarchaeota archaeon]